MGAKFSSNHKLIANWQKWFAKSNLLGFLVGLNKMDLLGIIAMVMTILHIPINYMNCFQRTNY